VLAIVLLALLVPGGSAAAISREIGRPTHYSAWLCIHRYEGSWTANTGNGYYGGLQFGYSEWRRYGMPYTGKAYAHQATPLQQMWAGERYWRDSGFYPWPATARACGLL